MPGGIQHHMLVGRRQRVGDKPLLLRFERCALQTAFLDDGLHRRTVEVFQQIPSAFWRFGCLGDHQREVINIVGAAARPRWIVSQGDGEISFPITGKTPAATVEHAQPAGLHQGVGAHFGQGFGPWRKAIFPAQISIELQAFDSGRLVQCAFGREEGVIDKLSAKDTHPSLPDLVPAGHIASPLGCAPIGIGFGQLLTGCEEVIDCPGRVIPLVGGHHGASLFKHVLVVINGDRGDVVGQTIDAAIVAVGFNGQIGEL